MTRFVMTMSEAADLLIESMVLAKGGEVFITKMPVLRIVDLARVMARDIAPLYGHDFEKIELKLVGARPGEKMWEELSTDEEAGRLLEGDKFLIVMPAGHTRAQREQTYAYDEIEVATSDIIYHSDRQQAMTDDEIVEMLAQEAVLPDKVVALKQAQTKEERQ